MITATAAGSKVAELAKKWEGEFYNKGVGEQCAMFVRHILGKIGLAPAPTKHADDGFETNLALASSFAGDDVGQKHTDPHDLLSGDIVLFQNTYGSWPRGTITHVGIYVGNGLVVDRPTFDGPVRMVPLVAHFGSTFKEARRLLCYKAWTPHA